MWRPGLAVRPDERRDAIAAFLVLFGFVGSHTMLETARDALFLAKVSASHLPWVFIGIAALSVVVTQLQQRFAGQLGGSRALAVWIAVAGAVTLAFWVLVPALGDAGVYALYIWSGVLTILVLVHFWTLLGTLFSITQAKRLYAIIGAGSVAGAIAGSGIASALAQVLSARHLVLAAALGLFATAVLPLAFTRQTAKAPLASEATSGLVANARFVVRHAYARKVAMLMITATVCVTLADFVFKSAVAEHVPGPELGAYFATISFALNIVSLIVQVGLVTFIVRRIGVSAALALLPLLLVVSGVGVIAFGTLAAALAIKGVDGSLRYSLHRTASELVFLPLGDEARRRTKSVVDIVGHRGGQAIASVAILALAAASAPPELLAGLLVVIAAFWLWTAGSLRAPYLDLFRSRLRGRRLSADDEQLHLDMASLETLARALDSENDNEVLAALEVLDGEHKPGMIPALILYHPSDVVVERALEVFTRANWKKVVPIIDRLADHPSPRVRAALLAARSVLDPDTRPLLMRLSFEESPDVRAAITVNLIASGEIFGSDAKERLDSIMRHGSATTKLALAEAIARRGTDGFSDVLVALAKTADPKLRLAAVRAIGRVRPRECLPMLVEMLGEERVRPEVQQILVDYGIAGFNALVAAIEDPTLSAICRVRLPATLSRFDPEPASAVLLEWLTREKDGAVRYQILRALERITKRVPSIVLDRELLDRTIDLTVSRAYRYLDRRIILTRGAAAIPARKTPGHLALVALLQDKQANAIQRLFSMFGLAYRTDDFTEIYRGVISPRKDVRSNSMELLENILREPLRSAALGLIDDLTDADRLAAAGRYHTHLDLDYEALLAQMLASTSESVQDLTVFHIGELRLAKFRTAIAALPNDGTRADITRTLALLDAREAS
jgi:AAA family ATP:ADP antiporter